MVFMKTNNKSYPTALIILDGFGYNPEITGNAIAQAQTPFWNWLTQNYPHTLLHASGQYVGLLPGYIGNSEVGHLNIGAGRIVQSILKKFHAAINDETIFKNKILIDNFSKLKKSNKSLHLIGLLSDGGVHSHEFHLHALLKMAITNGLKNIYIHPILDGRDVTPKSASIYLKRLEALCNSLGHGTIASVSGRFYAMDRDKNWDRTQQFYDMLVGQTKITPSPQQENNASWQNVLDNQYDQEITDEFINPTLLNSSGIIKPDDGVIFFNFRPDRAIQLTQSFIDPHFDKFPVQNVCSTKNTLAFFITTTRYKEEFSAYNNDILFERDQIKNTFFDVLAQQQNPPKVFIIAETEKYAHVTYFFRGMQDIQTPNETRILIPSIKTKNYISHPEMSANEITNAVLNSLQNNPADFYLINYANADMVGHSGDFDATVKACECLDKQLEKLYKQIVETMNGTIFITADHGNAEQKIDPIIGTPLTAHTKNPVPFVLVNKEMQRNQILNWPSNPKFGISSIAPTILNFTGFKKPKEMNCEIIEF